MLESSKRDVTVVTYPNGSVAHFKLYKTLKAKHISHNRFMRDTETGYDTMKRYACGEITKLDILVIDRWCRYLGCHFSDIVTFM